MCPPVPSPFFEIGSSDEQIILSLNDFNRGSPLPSNVIEWLNPYQYKPSNLPDGIWYFTSPNEKKETVSGFWKVKGEACEIYLNSELSGWRTTREFFEGEAPRGQRTDWLMQEYRITRKGLFHQTKPKVLAAASQHYSIPYNFFYLYHHQPTSQEPVWLDNVQVSRSLCRIFLSRRLSPRNEIHPKDCKTGVGAKRTDSVPSVIPNTVQDSTIKSDVKKVCEMGPLEMADIFSNAFPEDFTELECISTGDFLELNDLADPGSHSSSSENSSCPSRASDEYFDSLALLRDLEDENNKHLRGHDLSKYIVAASMRPNMVVMQPATLGSIHSCTGSKPAVEGFPTKSAVDPTFPDKQPVEHAVQRQKSKLRAEDTSNNYDADAPSTSHKPVPNEEKKAVGSRMKRLKEYLCFTRF